MARMLKGRYFPNCDFLEAQTGYRASFIWRSVMWGKRASGKGSSMANWGRSVCFDLFLQLASSRFLSLCEFGGDASFGYMG